MREPFSLATSVAENVSTNPRDVMKTKSGLKSLGLYAPPEWGMSEIPDRDMFDGIRAFQRQHDLKVDGVMKPEGPTAQKMDEVLGRHKTEPLNASWAAEDRQDEKKPAPDILALSDNQSEETDVAFLGPLLNIGRGLIRMMPKRAPAPLPKRVPVPPPVPPSLPQTPPATNPPPFPANPPRDETPQGRPAKPEDTLPRPFPAPSSEDAKPNITVTPDQSQEHTAPHIMEQRRFKAGEDMMDLTFDPNRNPDFRDNYQKWYEKEGRALEERVKNREEKVAPSESWIWNNLQKTGRIEQGREVRTNGRKGKDEVIFTFDRKSGEIEVFQGSGKVKKHIGVMDPVTGRMKKKKVVKGRNYEKSDREHHGSPYRFS